MKRILVISSFLLALTCSLLPGVEKVCLSIEPSTKKKGSHLLLIQNLWKGPISYFGYGGEGSTQPIYRIEIKEGEKWVDRSPGFCGNGTGPCQIKGLGKITVPIFHILPQDRKDTSFRVSISVLAKGKKDWDHKLAKKVYSPIYTWTNGLIKLDHTEEAKTTE